MRLAGAHYHVAGVAGVGMSAVAELLAASGAQVTGSDRFLDAGEQLPVLRTLERGGIRLTPQDGSAIHAATAGVVVSTAIEPDNPDRLRAEQLGCPVLHRAECLARLAAGHRLVAVTGTAGKTTVTGLTGWILEQAGWDPTVVAGGILREWERDHRVGNVRVGNADWWILEADESDRSLLAFAPSYALITNISQDHFPLPEVRDLFRRFAANVQGPLLLGPGLSPWFPGMEAKESEGQAERSPNGWRIRCRGRSLRTPLIGAHNAQNALAAVNLCDALGVPMTSIAAAVASFGGIRRRLEVIGRARGITVLDDYAHNPVKIAAAWQAAREQGDQVHGVWRPHGFGPLALMFDDLARAIGDTLRPGDHLYLLPVFYAGGVTAGGPNSAELGHTLRRHGLPVTCAESFDAVKRLLLARLQPGDVALVMGARDPGLPRFARALHRALDPDAPVPA